MEQEKRSEETRAAIETVCLKLFARQGIQATSLDEIARRAGISKGAIYWHYENKETLVLAVLGRVKAAWLTIVPTGIATCEVPEERLRQLFRNYTVLLTKHPDLSLFFQRIRLEVKVPYAPLIGRFFAESAAFVSEVIEYGVQRRAFHPPRDITVLSYHLISALAGAHAQWLSDRSLSLPALVDEVEYGVLLRLGVVKLPSGRGASPAARSRTVVSAPQT